MMLIPVNDKQGGWLNALPRHICISSAGSRWSYMTLSNSVILLIFQDHSTAILAVVSGNAVS